MFSGVKSAEASGIHSGTSQSRHIQVVSRRRCSPTLVHLYTWHALLGLSFLSVAGMVSGNYLALSLRGAGSLYLRPPVVASLSGSMTLWGFIIGSLVLGCLFPLSTNRGSWILESINKSLLSTHFSAVRNCGPQSPFWETLPSFFDQLLLFPRRQFHCHEEIETIEDSCTSCLHTIYVLSKVP
ncbi:hypothetical protein J6590_044529 [Homalodisca vitripennis]|nr:hypothetical protein J6590_044529 [Homalodisca vitripennis]